MRPTVISDEQASFFNENGYLIVRNMLDGWELAAVQAATQEMVEYGSEQERSDPDYSYGTGHITGARTLRRIDYVIDKHDAMKALLGNPAVLRSAEKLMGADLIPTWDAMVLKAPGEGIAVPWHRDAATDAAGDKSIFNVDFYLDPATEENCVWLLPGSQRWEKARAQSWIEQRSAQVTVEEFKSTGAVAALMQPGDVLFHDILVVHGSPASSAKALRRVVYYEFRPAHVEATIGPHVPEYIPLKQKLLLACIERRKAAEFVPGDEAPFEYRPPAPFDKVSLAPGECLPTYRYVHGDYWRA